MQSYTRTGLLLIMIGVLVGIIANISMFLTEGEITALNYVTSIGGLLSLVGIILMVAGRKEFGERHGKFVVYAIVLFIISMVISAVLISISIFLALVQGFGGDSSVLSYIFYVIPIGAILGGLNYIFLLYELENKEGKIVLFVAFIVTIITSIIMTINIIPIYEETIGSIYSHFGEITSSDITSLTSEFTQKISSAGIYGVINSVLILIAIYIPYRRIASGELAPVSTVTDLFSMQKISENTKRRCPDCGRIIPMDSNTCPYCGKKFEIYH